MGKNLYELCGIGEGELRTLFGKYRTCGRVADKLGISRRTVNKYARSLGLSLPAHRPLEPGRPKMTSGHGVVVQWLKEHPKTRLPTRVPDAARLIGTSPKVVYSYMKYRQSRFMEYLRAMPDLRSIPKVIVDIGGRPVALNLLKSYEVRFSIRDMRVKILGRLGDACMVRFEMPLGYFENLFKL